MATAHYWPVSADREGRNSTHKGHSNTSAKKGKRSFAGEAIGGSRRPAIDAGSADIKARNNWPASTRRAPRVSSSDSTHTLREDSARSSPGLRNGARAGPILAQTAACTPAAYPADCPKGAFELPIPSYTWDVGFRECCAFGLAINLTGGREIELIGIAKPGLYFGFPNNIYSVGHSFEDAAAELVAEVKLELGQRLGLA